jgi:hypothetical protein
MEEAKDHPTQPSSQCVYGGFVYWLSLIASMICTLAPVIAIAFPGRNIMNPYYLFSAIWEGKEPDLVWQRVSGGFPGGHFWLNSLTYGDGLIQLGLVLGCSSAGVALVATAIVYIKQKPRSYGWALACLALATLVSLAAVGIYQQAE